MSRRTHTDRWWETAPAHVLRCSAHYKDGTPCRTEASPGTNVCHKHGALAPAVQAAAATRIQMSVDDAARRLVEWMNDAGVDMRERVKIATDLLDRGGLGATSKVLVGVGPADPVETLFNSLLTQPGALVDRDAVVPGEVVPPPFDAAQAAIDAREEGPDLDTLYVLETGFSDVEHVVPGEVVEPEDLIGELPPHTERIEASMSDRPPKHLREDLERTAVLRKAGFW